MRAALWNYVNTPYLFTWDGFQVAEIEPWQEEGETWRRLRVQFPDYVDTHSRVQTFYFGAEDVLLRRQDYDVDIRGGVPRAHYTMDHVSVDGFSFPTRRRVVARNPDDTTEAEPVFVSLDVTSISLS
ncbi:hypothetical protein [Actinopolymorpha pittospori]|uniref:Uncharacterized protein n=1 Tax=Actinopolymorpha pittospori TaxID=648752 RepID=A0A927RB84_9ACTN|nr:hypothetical protein [Actinopolymorpha pittospori]MBE1608494.1 hypothetical protein [Actinopolymorpha pittospori]